MHKDTYLIFKQEAAKKAGQLAIRCVNCCIRVKILFCMVVNFRGGQIYIDFVRFLIHEDLYEWCLRYNICIAWFLDIRISTCLRANKYSIVNRMGN